MYHSKSFNNSVILEYQMFKSNIASVKLNVEKTFCYVSICFTGLMTSVNVFECMCKYRIKYKQSWIKIILKKFKKCVWSTVIPINSFNRIKRIESAAVSALYAYEVITIFEEIFLNDFGYNLSETLQNSWISFDTIKIQKGIFEELICKSLNFIMTGFKYYPLLLNQQSNQPIILIEILTFLYLMFILCINFYMDAFNSSYSIINTQFLFSIKFEKFLFYFVVCLMMIQLISKFITWMIKLIPCTKKNLSTTFLSHEMVSNEFMYVSFLINRQQKLSLFNLTVYSKSIINTNVIAFVFLYSISCIIISKSVQFSNVLILISTEFLHILPIYESAKALKYLNSSESIINDSITYINVHLVQSCCLTTLIYLIQIAFGLKAYQHHIQNAFKGVYNDIMSPNDLTNFRTMSNSLHYSGYAIGFLFWGYFILFSLILVIIFAFKLLFRFYFLLETLTQLLLPIVILILLKKIFIYYLTYYFLARKPGNLLTLKCKKIFFLLSHFNFFFDCFLGSFLSILRIIKSCFVSLIFMPRLDYSVFGRSMESYDSGYLSYVSLIHLEAKQTNPIVITFCEILLKQKRKSKNSRSAQKMWFIIIMLCKNPSLVKFRRNHLEKQIRLKMKHSKSKINKKF